jgi:hypothetical protein
MACSSYITVLSLAATIILGSAHAGDTDGKSKVYHALASIAVNLADAEMSPFIQTIRSFAASRNFRLVLGGYPKFTRSVINLEIHVGRDSYFYGSNFLDANRFVLIARSHEEDSVWQPAWKELIANISLQFGEDRITQTK